MSNSSRCPTAPFPGLIKGGAGHQFALAATIMYPIFLVAAITSFWYYRKSSIFLRKRSLRLIILGAVLSFGCWSSSALFDYIGSENYPCVLLTFTTYVANPLISYPLVLKMANYFNHVSYYRLSRELQEDRGTFQDGIAGKDPLAGELSLATTAGHLRVAFCFSRKKEDRILNAKFSRTYGFPVLWFAFTAAPFIIGFLVRLAMNPQWIGCTGCEIEVVDAVYLIIVAVFALVLSAFANPSFSTRVSKRDALRIVRECMWSWMLGGIFYNLSFILFIADPGQVYARGLFNWRLFILLAMAVLFYVQTFHQIFVARRQKHIVLLAPILDQSERFREVMADRELRKKLEGFMDSELSSEVLLFLNAVDRYQISFESDHGQAFARQIYSTFVVRGSPSEVNIGSLIRNELVAEFGQGGTVGVGVFDHAYSEVKKSFLEDGFSRFLRRLEKEQLRYQTQVAVGLENDATVVSKLV